MLLPYAGPTFLINQNLGSSLIFMSTIKFDCCTKLNHSTGSLRVCSFKHFVTDESHLLQFKNKCLAQTYSGYIWQEEIIDLFVKVILETYWKINIYFLFFFFFRPNSGHCMYCIWYTCEDFLLPFFLNQKMGENKSPLVMELVSHSVFVSLNWSHLYKQRALLNKAENNSAAVMMILFFFFLKSDVIYLLQKLFSFCSH